MDDHSSFDILVTSVFVVFAAGFDGHKQLIFIYRFLIIKIEIKKLKTSLRSSSSSHI